MVFKHKIGVVSKYTKKLTIAIAAFALVVQPMYGLITSQVANAASVNVCSGGCNSSDIDTILADSVAGDTLELQGNITLSKMMKIDKAITINGNGFSIFAAFAFTDNTNNAAVSLSNANDVVLNNLKVTNTTGSGLHGINAFKGSSNLNSVTISNFSKYGLVVNGSNVTVNSISTAANGWGGVDVDQSSTSSTALLTINGTSTHTDTGNATALGLTKHLFIDNTTKDVAITDTGSQYNTTTIGNARVYTLKPATISPPAPAPQTPRTVLQSDFSNAYTTWTYHNDNADPGSAATPAPDTTHKVSANPTPTAGDNGAVKLNTASGEKWNLASLQYSGTKLREIAKLGFSANTSNPGSAYITLDVDFNHPGTSGYQGRLAYMPNLTANAWVDSEAVASNGQWSISPNYNWPDGSTSETRSWNEIINAFPDATITAVDNQAFGSLYLRSDGASTTYFDNVYLATSDKNIKYNFELPTPGAPQSLTPLNGTVTNNTAFTNTWSPVDGAVSYEYRTSNELTNGVELGAIIYSDSSATASNYNTASNPVARSNSGTPEGNYFWQVRAVNADGIQGPWSVINKVTVDTQKPSTPTNGLPNGTFKNTNDFFFTWNESTDSYGPLTYEFQSSISDAVNPDGSFVGAWNSIADGNAEQRNLTTPTIHSTGAGDGTYFWQVRAIDGAGNKSDWSTTWSMTIDTTAPAVPSNLRMVDETGDIANDGTTSSYDIDAMWDSSQGASGYVYKYWNDIPGNQYKEGTPYITNVPATVNPGQFNQGYGAHYFAVKAVDAAGNESAWSTPYKITYTVAQIQPEDNDTPDSNPEGSNNTAEESTFSPASARTAVQTTAPAPAFFQNIATVFNNDGTVSALTAPAGETTDQNGQVLGAEDSLAKNAAQADSSSNGTYKLLGFAWYWVIAALAALLAGWWLIAGYRRRKDEQA